MRTLWSHAAAAALAAAALGACASPHYPVQEGAAAGPPPLTFARPAYPIHASDAAVPAAASAPAAAPAEPPTTEPPLAAPTPEVESQPLPPPGPVANAGPTSGARLVLVSTAAESVTTPTPPPSPTTPTAPAADAAPPPAPSAEDSGLTPSMVVHDRASLAAPAPSPPPAPAAPALVRQRQAWSAPVAERREAERAAAFGDVVRASGDVLERYEVQRGDHVDQLARAFSTTRSVIVDANGLRPPYALHPGEIVKVPVAKAYVARGGDTLAVVARRFSVPVDELAELNHVSTRSELRAGQEIGLPSSFRDVGAQQVAAAEPRSVERYADAAPTPRRVYQAPARTEPGSGAGYYAHPYIAGRAQAAPPVEHRITEIGASAPPMPVERSAPYATTVPPAVAAQAALSDTQIAQAARGRFVWPVRGDIVAKFGAQGVGRRNDGVDIRADEGTLVKAAAPGEVVYAGDQVPGFGNLVLIKHADGWVTAYAHLASVDVAMRQQVSQGQSLGAVGMTGGVQQPELHFEVRYAPTPADKARPVDPVLVLPVG